MNVGEAIRQRRSIRAYEPKPVPQDMLLDIMETCQWSGSFLNMQPVECAVVGGQVMKEWKKRLIEKYKAGAPDEKEYPIGEMPFPEPFFQRAESFRAGIDNLMFPPGEADLEQKRYDYTISGIKVRDAPNAVVIYTERRFLNQPLHIMAAGIMAQSICLAAMDYGLGTCIMGKPAETPGILRDLLGIPQSKIIMLVVAIGYTDTGARINSLKRRRIPLDEWVHWHGF